jgi:hypothetical protein
MPATTAKSTKARTTKASTAKVPTAKVPTAKASSSKVPTAKVPTAKATTAKAPQPRVTAAASKGKAAKLKSAAAKTADLSADVFTSVEAGQRTALAAVRTFVDTVDEALPTLGAHASRRETVIDAALDMADKLVTSQYNFLRHVVRSADRSLRLSDSKKK